MWFDDDDIDDTTWIGCAPASHSGTHKTARCLAESMEIGNETQNKNTIGKIWFSFSCFCRFPEGNSAFPLTCKSLKCFEIKCLSDYEIVLPILCMCVCVGACESSRMQGKKHFILLRRNYQILILLKFNKLFSALTSIPGIMLLLLISERIISYSENLIPKSFAQLFFHHAHTHNYIHSYTE